MNRRLLALLLAVCLVGCATLAAANLASESELSEASFSSEESIPADVGSKEKSSDLNSESAAAASASAVGSSTSAAPDVGSSADSSSSVPNPAPSSSSAEHQSEDVQTEETGSRDVKEISGNTGGKLTIISNTNTLRSIQKPVKQTNYAQIFEEQRKTSTEEGQKKKEEQDREQAIKAKEKRMKEEEEASKREAEQTQKKAVAEAADKKLKEESDKKAVEDKQKADAKEQADKKAAEEKQKADEKAKEEDAKKKAQEAEDAEKKEKEQAEKKKQEEEAKRQRVQLDGWSNYENSYENNVVVKWNRFVFVEGLIRGGSGYIGQLPDDCRPYDGRLIFGLMKGNYNGRVDVLQDGRIYWITAGDSDWLSFNGISFDTNLANGLELIWGWVSYGYGYRQVTQSKQDDLCMISGLIRSGSWNYLGRVADWCTPNAGQLIFSCNNHDQTTRVDLATNGYFFRQGGGANYGWVSLDGMAWSPGGGNEISLYNGWNHYYSGYRTARYQRIGKVCVLSGLIRSGNWDGHITTLPSGCRPRKRIIFGVNNQDRMCRVDVLPGGEVYYISMRIGYDWLPLDGIKFIAHQ